MIVFCSAEGTVTKVLPSPVYQGSSLSGGLYFVAPFPSSNTVTVAFQLANGDFTTDYLLSPITENDNELQDVFDKLGKNYSVWEWQADNGFVTAYAGEVTAQFKVVYAKNGVAQLQTTASVVFTVQKGVEALPAAPPSDKQWNDLLALYTQLTADLKALGAPSVEPLAATVPLRDKNGNVKTNEPQADNDAANKKFVGEKIAELSGEKSNATNLENGSAAGSLQQKSATYAQMINDFEPNMAAYIIAKNGGMVPANLQAYLAALQSSTIATSEAIITILDTRRNDVNTVITNFKTLPSPYTDYGIDNLIAVQLADYGIYPLSDLSNIVGEAGDISTVLGSMNKVFAPGAFAGGVNSEAGDKGYPSETMGAFAYGDNVKVKSKWAIGFGKDLLNLGDYSAMFGKDLLNLGDYSTMFGKGDPEYKIDKDASAGDQNNQRKYLDHLADAGGTVVGTGDNRRGVTGVNKGFCNIVTGLSHYIGNRAINNSVFGNQNILGPRIGDSDNANNLISGLLHYIKASANCGVFGQANEVYYCANSLIAGESLKASKVYHAFIIGRCNVDKPDRYIIVGNGTSDADRSNAFEVLKDGRAKVQTAPKDNDDVVRLKELNAVGGKLYQHRVMFVPQDMQFGVAHFISFSSKEFTQTDLNGKFFVTGYVQNEGNPQPITYVIVEMSFDAAFYYIKDDSLTSVKVGEFIQDTVTEL